jgi:hypothetical protein
LYLYNINNNASKKLIINAFKNQKKHQSHNDQFYIYLDKLLTPYNETKAKEILQICFEKLDKFSPENTCLNKEFKNDVLRMHRKSQKIEFNIPNVNTNSEYIEYYRELGTTPIQPIYIKKENYINKKNTPQKNNVNKEDILQITHSIMNILLKNAIKTSKTNAK